MNKNTLLRYLPLLVLILLFILIKHDSPGVRLSDTAIYFATAKKLSEGAILYKDIFFTNFPLFAYIALFYGFITQWNIAVFFATPILEVIVIAGFIYHISLKTFNNRFVSSIATAIYLFSFLVLATSDHQTGVFSAGILSITGYYFAKRKQYYLAGIFWGLAVMTKAYFLPIPISFIVALLFEHRKDSLKIIISFGISVVLIIALFSLLSGNKLFSDIFAYSLIRGQGISKLNIVRFLITKDWIFLTLFILNIFLLKRKQFFGFLSLFSILFFVFYKDIYYLYLNFLAPFLALSLTDWIQKGITKRDTKVFLILVVGFSVFITVLTYRTNYKDAQKYDIEKFSKKIQEIHPQVLYGINSITPLLSLTTNTPLLNNILDTNENMYRSHILNAESMTKKALTQNAVFVAASAFYPESTISIPFVSEIFDKKLLTTCKLLYQEPITTEGLVNYLSLIQCEEN